MNKRKNFNSKDSLFAKLHTYRMEKLRCAIALGLLLIGLKEHDSIKNMTKHEEDISGKVLASVEDTSKTINNSTRNIGEVSKPDTKEQVTFTYDYASNVVTEVIDAEKEAIIKEKIYNLMMKEKLNSEKLMTLLNYMVEGNSPFSFGCNNIQDALNLLLNNSEYSYELKMLIVMVRDGYTYDQLDSVCAGVVAEAAGAGTNITDAWAVASILVNRTRDAGYVNNHTTSLYEQFTAPSQFSVYDTEDPSVSYKQYLGRIDLPGYQTAIQTFYTRESMHDWKEFRGWWVDVSMYESEQYVYHGNQFIIQMDPAKYLPDSEFVLDEAEAQSFVSDFEAQGFVIENDAVMKLTLTP